MFKTGNNWISLEFKALGTDVYLELVLKAEEKVAAKKSLTAAKKEVGRIEQIFSRFLRNSELTKLNNNLGRAREASREMRYLVKRTLELFSKSGGWFDPRVISYLEAWGYQKRLPVRKLKDKQINFEGLADLFSESLNDDLKLEETKIVFLKKMDLAGLAKAFAVKKAAEVFRKAGFNNYLVDAGGDILARGHNRHGNNWQIGIEGSEGLLIDLSGRSVATSGITRRHWQLGDKRYHHLVNPKQPLRQNWDLKTVTVVDKDIEEADFWAKLLFLKGLRKGLALAKKESKESYFLTREGKLVKALKEKFE